MSSIDLKKINSGKNKDLISKNGSDKSIVQSLSALLNKDIQIFSKKPCR